jgi:cobalt-zinc-cadmium efflux system membrane fusion protein
MNRRFAFCVLLLVPIGLVGCSKSSETATAPATTTAAAEGEHVHGEWWCDEHGVPEDVCVQCDSTLVADFKAKGDWCEEHSRPDSQCFICHPEKEAEFAALYEAKYGTKPPKPEIGGEAHDHDEHEHEAEKQS